MWLCCPMRSRRVVSRTSATLIALAEEEEEDEEEDEDEAIREAGARAAEGVAREGARTRRESSLARLQP